MTDPQHPKGSEPASAPAQAVAAVRADPIIARQLYRSIMGPIFGVVGLFVAYNTSYPPAIDISVGAIFAIVGAVISVLALVGGVRMQQAGHFPRFARGTMVFVVAVFALAWVLASAFHL